MAQRQLQFQALDDVASDIDVLLAAGYTKVGNWNLSQVCGHLDQWMGFAMDGFPKPPFPINAVLWTMKMTVGKKLLRQILTSGFKPGGPTMPQTVPEAGSTDDETAVRAFKETLSRFASYTGPIHPSPLYGQLDRDTAVQLQLAHCAHHLSFLLPK